MLTLYLVNKLKKKMVRYEIDMHITFIIIIIIIIIILTIINAYN